MTGFVVPPVVPDTPAAPLPVIANDGWYPPIDTADFVARMNVRDVTAPRLREALLGAMIWTAPQLAGWQSAQILLGYVDLASVPAPTLDGESRNAILYRRAVYAWAKADLTERYRSTDLTSTGQRRAEDLDPAIGELRRDAIHAVRDLLGRTRTDIELI